MIELSHAEKAFESWKLMSFSDRSALFRNLSTVLMKNRDSYARTITEEMGKPIREALAEIEKCAYGCTFYAENAERFLMDEVVQTEALRSTVSYRPLGIILAIMPWNYPFWQVFRFAAPTLMAGNVSVLKHASNVPKCSKAIENAFVAAGFPKDVFTSLLISATEAQNLIADRRIAAVTLTGSTAAGKKVAEQCGKFLKKCVLELGGSDPFVVLSDANIDEAVRIGVQSRTLNAGQSCIAAKRFIVERSVQKTFEQKFVERMKSLIVGDPMKMETQIGPIARVDLRDELHNQVQKSVSKGAQLLCGGTLMDGAFYPPTVLSDVKPGMPAYDEELFGPVAAIITANSNDEALTIANDTLFGLGASVFTQDKNRGEKIAREHLDAGLCFVNSMVRSDPRLPFGGIKQSGYGRELSTFGIREFVNIKTVWVE